MKTKDLQTYMVKSEKSFQETQTIQERRRRVKNDDLDTDEKANGSFKKNSIKPMLRNRSVKHDQKLETQNDEDKLRTQHFTQFQQLSQSQNKLNEFQTFKLHTVGNMLPHPNYRIFSSDYSSDFMFLSDFVCGVADGVSQWKRYQIDPKYFTKQLLVNTCNCIQNYIADFDFESRNQIIEASRAYALKSLERGFKQIEYAGSSTIIFYFIIEDLLFVNWIGDSQLIILRPYQNTYNLVYKTEPDVYGFNQPKQLIKFPENAYLDNLKNQGKSKLYGELKTLMKSAKKGRPTKPKDLVQETIKVKKDDIIICGSDGFFDNIYDQDIIFLLNEHKECDLQELSMILSRNAWEASQNPEYDSPFANEYKKGGSYFMGGKPDDVTVVISRVCH